MTAFSTFPGGMSAGLNALSSPLGGALPAPLLMGLLNRAGAGGMPGSLAPQIPNLPGGSRGAVGPVPTIPPAPQPPQNSSLLSLLGGLGGGGPGRALGGPSQAGANAPFNWTLSNGLFGGAGPLFGPGAPFMGVSGWQQVAPNSFMSPITDITGSTVTAGTGAIDLGSALAALPQSLLDSL